jgi:hypothetical protein
VQVCKIVNFTVCLLLNVCVVNYEIAGKSWYSSLLPIAQVGSVAQVASMLKPAITVFLKLWAVVCRQSPNHFYSAQY